MFPVFVLKKVIDAFLLHQAAHEIEIGFAILDTIFALGVGDRKLGSVVIEPMSFENRLNNFGNRHVLKNAAIRGASKEPEPGYHRDAIVSIAADVCKLHD